MLKVAICGASGYAGTELIRILLGHPKVRITALTSERSAGKPPAAVNGQLRGYKLPAFEPLNKNRLAEKADFFFMALPHAASQEAVNHFYKKGKKLVDLSADFRLKNHLIYEQWYKTPHKFVKTLSKAVYGLPELHRKRIKGASLVANPGCYPTGAIIALYPLLKARCIDNNTIVIDSKSGTSGAGRKAEVSFSFCEVNEGVRAYGVTTHRHQPEIEQELSGVADEPVAVNFTPHLLPIDRGLLSTVYARVSRRFSFDKLYGIFEKAYAGEPFVRVLEPGAMPNVKSVRGTNFCDIGLAYNTRTSTVIVVTAIDNLVKGASGQAVQCMNIMKGFKETTALQSPGIFP